jgi:hypothetical protein
MSPLQDAPRLAERYRFDELIGLGGTARVHRATDRRTGGQVAIKILNADVDVRRLTVNGLAEIPAHPGLVGILESGVDEGRGYVVMPLVEGGSLADLVEDGPDDPERVARIGAQVAAALAHLHGLDVVHRDVKPANVLLDAAGNAHLADLGVARLLDAAHVTSSGIAVGTPAYMAPEQVKGQEVHPPADVYSLGLVLLEALTGRREYAGAVLESAVARIHRRPDVPAYIPPRLRGLLVAMTADRPADRPTAAQVCARLSAPRPRTIPLPALGPRHRTAEPAARRVWRRWAVAAVGVAAAAGAVALVGEATQESPTADAVGAPTVPSAPAAPADGVVGGVVGAAVAQMHATATETPVVDVARTVTAPTTQARPAPGRPENGQATSGAQDGKGNGNGNGKGKGSGNGKGRG